jgi:hypothetical protein
VLNATKTSIVIGGVVMLTTTSLLAQSSQSRNVDLVRGRLQIVNMENALREAVRSGANRLTSQLKSLGPVDSAVLMNTPEANGFVVPQGMFFYVRVPTMSSVVVWALPRLIDQQRVQAQIDQQRVQAQNVSTTRPVEQVPPVAPVDADLAKDPRGAYRNAVRASLIDCMLDDSGNLDIKAEEYLTIAARRDSRPNPLDLTDEARTITLIVRGSVLEALHQKRITKEEARKQVEMRED